MPQSKTANSAAKVTVSEPNRLYRSESDKMIAGVCGGIADYFGVDSSLVRILFITITLFGGGGIIIYVLLWAFIPSEIAARKSLPRKAVSTTSVRTTARSLFGLFVVLIGLYFLLANFGVVMWLPVGKLWPLILIVIGIVMFWKQK